MDEKNLDQLTLASHQYCRKSFESSALRHVRVRIHPSQSQSQLLTRNISLLNSIDQMRVQRRWEVLPVNVWHNSLAIKPTGHGGLSTSDLCRILGIGQAIRQLAQFIRAELATASELQRVLNYLGLFVRRQLVNFFNYFGRSHELKLPASRHTDKL